jgi:hypothetical protein
MEIQGKGGWRRVKGARRYGVNALPFCHLVKEQSINLV